MSEQKRRVRTIYRQNFLLTTGVVLLTLVLLGLAFFALSYSYTRSARAADMRAKAGVVSRMVSSYVRNGSLSGMRALAMFAASGTEEDFLICNYQYARNCIFISVESALSICYYGEKAIRRARQWLRKIAHGARAAAQATSGKGRNSSLFWYGKSF